MEYKISILVAAYNAEKYIRKCLDSLVNQTLHEIQIICIDDGSTDGTLGIIRQYADKDSRIKVLAQQINQGLAKARNLGLTMATGEFVTMVDSDDWIDSDALEKIYNTFLTYPETDAVLFRLLLYMQDKEEYIPYKMRSDKKVFKGKEAFLLTLEWDIHGVYVIRNEIHQHIPYDDTSRLYSDENTTRIHFIHCREVRMSEAIYNYRQYSGSVTKKCSIYQFDILDAGVSLKKALFLEGVDDNVLSALESLCWKNLIGMYGYYLRNKKNFTAEEQRMILEKFRFHLRQINVKHINLLLRCKFGYIPFTKHFKIFQIQSCIYLNVQSVVHKIRGIK